MPDGTAASKQILRALNNVISWAEREKRKEKKRKKRKEQKRKEKKRKGKKRKVKKRKEKKKNENKRKEKLTLFSDHRGSLPRRQPGSIFWADAGTAQA